MTSPVLSCPFCTEHHHANPDLGGACSEGGNKMDGMARQGCLCGVTLASFAFFFFFTILLFPNIGKPLSLGVGFTDTTDT